MKLVKVLAMMCVLGIVGYAMAADEPAHKPKGIRGKIVKVDGTNVVIKTRARGEKEAKEVTVATDDKTAVTIDKKDAKVADLKADMFVFVTPAEGTATKIVASTEAPKRHTPKAPK